MLQCDTGDIATDKIMCQAEWFSTKHTLRMQSETQLMMAVIGDNAWCTCSDVVGCFWCGLSDMPDNFWDHGCTMPATTMPTTPADLGTPAQPALLCPDVLSLADALPGCLCTSQELCSWCSFSLVASSPPIPLENHWEHLKSVKYGGKSRAAKRCFSSDAEQGSSTKVTFSNAFNRHAFKDSIDFDLATKMKRVKITSTLSDSRATFTGSHTYGRSSAGNDENIALPHHALPGNGSSSGTSCSAEF